MCVNYCSTLRSVGLMLALSLCAFGSAQDYITPGQYAFQVERDVAFGTAMNYLGRTDTLKLDVYSPLGNSDTERPLLVLVHGGTWLGGCKDEGGIVTLAQQFVGRGYVVASINYRLGWHKAEFVQGNVAGFGVSPWPEAYRAFYPLDSAEIKRAIYRGMQDTKGAIRFLKARAAQDSVCTDKVFVGGESAGGFVALAVAFLDRVEEKPDVCGMMDAALEPSPFVLNKTAFECDTLSIAVTEEMLLRPDLGSVEGELNANGYAASVKGVANFFGGVPQEAFGLDWWQGVDTPAVYLYHQTADGIVLFGNARPYTTMSAYCNLGAAPWHPRYPIMSGSGAIKNAFDQMGSPPLHTTDFQAVAPFNPDIAVFDCLRYADNGSYHFINGVAARAQNLADFFAPLASGSTNCINTAVNAVLEPARPTIHPQPGSDIVHVNGSRTKLFLLLDGAGRTIRTVALNKGALDVSDLDPGIYFLAPLNSAHMSIRFVVAR